MDSSASSLKKVRKGDHLSEELTDIAALSKLLICILCKQDLTPPVLQCQFGHLVCQGCHDYKVVVGQECCPLCDNTTRSAFTRTVAIENILHGTQVTCKNAALGCTTLSPLISKREHENRCAYTLISCPIPSCAQAVRYGGRHKHLQTTHNVQRWVDTNKDSFFLNPSASQVLLQHTNFGKCEVFYLLHQVHTPMGRKLRVTTLRDPHRVRFKLKVRVLGCNDEPCFKFESTSHSQEKAGGDFLLVPGPPSRNLQCEIEFLDGDE